MLDLMDKAGCYLIGFGVESGVQSILDFAKKGINLEHSKKAFNLIKNTNIKSAAHIIFGLAPFETEQTIKQTLDFVKELDPDYANFHIATPYPGTALYNLYKRKRLIADTNTANLESNKATISLPDLTQKEIEKQRRKAFRKFYLNPSFILKELKQTKSIKQKLNLFGNGLWFMDGWVKRKN